MEKVFLNYSKPILPVLAMKSLFLLTGFFCLFSKPGFAQTATSASEMSIESAVARYRELDAKRSAIRQNLKDAEVRSIRSLTREGPRDEFETESDFSKRLQDNERKRAEIAGKFMLIEKDTLGPIEAEIEKLTALRFPAETAQVSLGAYDIDNKRFGRVYLTISYTTGISKNGKRSKQAGTERELEAVAVLSLVPDQARFFRDNEASLQVDPPLCITPKGQIGMAKEVRVIEPKSGISGMFTDCRTAYQKSPSTGMRLVYIPAGSFRMGSPNGDDDEKPVHDVIIPRGFFLGEYEVTQAEWKTLMGSNPSFFRDDERPVENVTYDLALQFVQKLNEREKTTAYRLPTEAEWEYACRAGKSTEWSFGAQEAFISSYAWHYENANRQTHPVGQKAPNSWGLFDMHGNVWEWVSDWYAADYYKKSDSTNPTGPQKGDYRILRGGSWNGRPTYSRSANRYPNYPNVPDKEFGLRILKMEE